jgi:hypothetical protein
MDNRKFIIECEVPERWVNDFCAMLEQMQYFGKQGHSGVIGIYADGDGDFRPNFNIQTEYDSAWATQAERFEPYTIYDAG